MEEEIKTPVEDTKETEVDEVDEMRIHNDNLEKELLRQEKLRAQVMKGGKSEAGEVPPKPVPQTAEQYAEKVNAGEVNPLHEDGYI